MIFSVFYLRQSFIQNSLQLKSLRYFISNCQDPAKAISTSDHRSDPINLPINCILTQILGKDSRKISSQFHNGSKFIHLIVLECKFRHLQPNFLKSCSVKLEICQNWFILQKQYFAFEKGIYIIFCDSLSQISLS